MHNSLVGSRHFHRTLNKVVKHIEKHTYRFVEIEEGNHKKLILTKTRKEKQ